MRERSFVFRFLAVAVLVFSLLAVAKTQVRLELSSYKVTTYTDEQGHKLERLEPALKVSPGDVLEWRLRAVNTSGQRLKNVALVIPIPPQTYYLEGTAAPLKIKRGKQEVVVLPEFSYDGGKHYGRPPLYKEVTVEENGKKVVKKVQVAPEEYTHVRWVLSEMDPEQAVEVFLRTKVR